MIQESQKKVSFTYLFMCMIRYVDSQFDELLGWSLDSVLQHLLANRCSLILKHHPQNAKHGDLFLLLGGII